jgi:hypothetical protein
VDEKAFMGRVTDYAKLTGWLVYHTHDSRRSQPGFPDLVLLRAPVALFVECKSERGRLRAEQAVFLDTLTACGCDARVWRPGDWPEVVETLRR